jgi:hypothetical protein
MLSGEETAVATRNNTTLTLVITNQTLSGDVLYMVTTGKVESKRIDPVSLGLLASDVAWDAVLRCRK